MNTPPEPPIPANAIDGHPWPALPGNKGQALLSLLFQFQQSEFWDAEKLRRKQFEQARALLKHAWQTVPFYRQHFKACGFAPDFENIQENWNRLPILKRSDIQQAGKDLYSKAHPKSHGRISDIHTSGSTGTPIRALRSELTLLFWSAFTLRDHLWHGRDFSGKLAVIRDSTPGKAEFPAGEHYKYWGSSRRAFDTGPSVSLNINTAIPQQLQWLVKQQPRYLLTHPTNLSALARYAIQHDIQLPSLHHIQTLGEILRPETRALCLEAWNVTVKDIYSGREVGYIALQCPEHDHYHVQSEGVIVDILDDNGNPCGIGETGRVIVTPLHNYAMPMIRYDIGDYATRGGACACGRGSDVLTTIEGREQNRLSLQDGGKRWTLLSESNIRRMLEMAPIHEYQFIQKDLTTIEVRLSVFKALTKKQENSLIALFKTKFGGNSRINIIYMDSLPREKSGKRQDFISEVS